SGFLQSWKSTGVAGMVNLGVIGYGYWGPNLVRNFNELDSVRVVSVCDRRPERRALLEKRYPSIKATSDARDIIDDAKINAVAIATPVASHYELAMAALRAGKHVLVEKPLASTSAQ